MAGITDIDKVPAQLWQHIPLPEQSGNNSFHLLLLCGLNNFDFECVMNKYRKIPCVPGNLESESSSLVNVNRVLKEDYVRDGMRFRIYNLSKTCSANIDYTIKKDEVNTWDILIWNDFMCVGDSAMISLAESFSSYN